MAEFPVDYSTLDDKRLITAIGLGQPEALDELYQRYHRLIFSLAVNIISDRATAEEITLDVFTRVWEKAETYRPDLAQVSTWLTSITRYRAIDLLRRRDSRPDYRSVSWAEVSADIPANPVDNPEELTELAIRRQAVQAALAQLPPEQREVLALAYFKGYSHSQIAETLNQPLGTVKTRVRLAMQKLRQSLPEQQPRPRDI